MTNIRRSVSKKILAAVNRRLLNQTYNFIWYAEQEVAIIPVGFTTENDAISVQKMLIESKDMSREELSMQRNFKRLSIKISSFQNMATDAWMALIYVEKPTESILPALSAETDVFSRLPDVMLNSQLKKRVDEMLVEKRSTQARVKRARTEEPNVAHSATPFFSQVQTRSGAQSLMPDADEPLDLPDAVQLIMPDVAPFASSPSPLPLFSPSSPSSSLSSLLSPSLFAPTLQDEDIADAVAVCSWVNSV